MLQSVNSHLVLLAEQEIILEAAHRWLRPQSITWVMPPRTHRDVQPAGTRRASWSAVRWCIFELVSMIERVAR
jgi:hypothetical protein